MRLDEIQTAIRGELDPGSAFAVLRQVANRVTTHPGDADTQDLVILALERRDDFPQPMREIVQSLASKVGLHPYLDPQELALSELLAYEFNRPLNLDGDDIVFHQAQSEVYRYLMAGESVILSAPTSFGKSLIIDAVIASGMYENIVVVVPTIALIDETRRRLSRFKPEYQVVTHPSQRLAARNVFVLTQERVLDFPDLPSIDFFVIDEFYKLSIETEKDRSALLNLAFYKLNKTARAFYMLGPNIAAITQAAAGNVNARFLKSDFKTVATEIVSVPQADRTEEGLVRLCLEQEEPTLVYCTSPASARRVGHALVEALDGRDVPELTDAVEWVSRAYHPEWSYARCLARGVGLHHGRIPRALQQMSVRLFNEGLIRYMVCTSTLIEGVNTAAKNVMIYDKKIGRRNLDFFTFANIRGRAGRMRRHFVGRVFLFIDPPQESLPLVDIPVLSQPNDLPMQVVVEMDARDLSDGSSERLRPLSEQEDLPMSTIKDNMGVDPDQQVALARRLRGLTNGQLSAMAWNGLPTSAQLLDLCNMIWSSFFRSETGGVRTGRQLYARMNIARSRTLKQWIDSDAASPNSDPDEVVEQALTFLRTWCGFLFPRYARAVERIVRHEQARRNLRLASYGFFLGQVESMFLPPMVAALDEYGIPIQVGVRVERLRGLPDDLDGAVDVVRTAADQGLLTPFERTFVDAAVGQPSLGGRLGQRSLDL